MLLVIFNRSAHLSLKAPHAKPAPLWAAYEYQLQLQLIKISRRISSHLITEEESCTSGSPKLNIFCSDIRVYKKYFDFLDFMNNAVRIRIIIQLYSSSVRRIEIEEYFRCYWLVTSYEALYYWLLQHNYYGFIIFIFTISSLVVHETNCLTCIYYTGNR